ncbi:MAG: Pyridoxal-dependent decarboxylase, partial [Acidobacteria bacterium]|nr:Pyridoxal-dependent decarboxylase [Acidobacteriota bacterium]
DDMLDYLADIPNRPVWVPMPDAVRNHFRAGLGGAATPLQDVHREFLDYVLPYAGGNVHPAFMGWVQGGGTVTGMLAEMLAGGLNANLGGRDHAPIEVERQIVSWVRDLFGFPGSASGLFVTGTSMANLLAVLVARTSELGKLARTEGIGAAGQTLRAYASTGAHGCVAQAMDLAGFGSDALRLVPMDAFSRMDVAILRNMIAHDRAAGLRPFLVVGSAGTVDVGAVDDLAAIARACIDDKLWFHIDGAYGALGMLSPTVAPRLDGIGAADSIAFDFHKWGQVPYDAGFLLVRDGQQHFETFASPAAYLRREARGMAAGSPWPCDFGPDLSRGFRALKTWFTLKVHGADALGASITRSCGLAQYLERRICAEPALELLAPVQLNIVCFRYRADDRVNADIVTVLQERGIAAPSTTMVGDKLAIRAALFNHRTRPSDLDALVDGVLRLGAEANWPPPLPNPITSREYPGSTSYPVQGVFGMRSPAK